MWRRRTGCATDPCCSSTGSTIRRSGIAYARSARAFLETLPLDLDYREFDMGHTTTDESMTVVGDWLSERLGP